MFINILCVSPKVVWFFLFKEYFFFNHDFEIFKKNFSSVLHLQCYIGFGCITQLIQYFIDLFRFCSLVYFYFLFLMVVLNLIFIFFQVCEILIADFFLMAYLVVKLFIYPFSLLSMLHKLQFHLMCHSIALLY